MSPMTTTAQHSASLDVVGSSSVLHSRCRKVPSRGQHGTPELRLAVVVAALEDANGFL